MIFALLVLLAGGLPQSTLARLPKSTLPDEPKVVAKVAVKKPQVAGLHTHVCPRCRYAWEHGAEHNGRVESHLCPKCGTLQWKIDHYGGIKIEKQCPT